MANTTRAQIISDLCQKYPTGPRGRIRKDHYTVKTAWVAEYGRSKEIHVLERELPFHPEELNPFFGYNPVDLYKLGIRCEDEAKTAIKRSSPEDSKQTVNRRGRLLWTRLKAAVNHVRKTGTTGAWLVRWECHGWGHPLYQGLYFHADSAPAAETQARFIGPMLGISPSAPLRVSFHDIITPDEASRLNGETINSTLNSKLEEIETLERRLDRAREAAESLREAAGKMMGAVMLLNNDEDEPDAGEVEAE